MSGGKPSFVYWVVGVLATAWNSVGVMSYVESVRRTPEAIAALPEAERALMAATPAWVTGAFAVAVFGGVAGSLMLLLRSRWSGAVLTLSLLAAIAQFGYLYGVAGAYGVLGNAGAGMAAGIILVGVFLVWYAGRAKARGWLR